MRNKYICYNGLLYEPNVTCVTGHYTLLSSKLSPVCSACEDRCMGSKNGILLQNNRDSCFWMLAYTWSWPRTITQNIKVAAPFVYNAKHLWHTFQYNNTTYCVKEGNGLKWMSIEALYYHGNPLLQTPHPPLHEMPCVDLWWMWL